MLSNTSIHLHDSYDTVERGVIRHSEPDTYVSTSFGLRVVKITGRHEIKYILSLTQVTKRKGTINT